MKTTLVIMAAGLATRFGGGKQVANMGPHGEMLMEYSIHDALRAGYRRIVFVIRREMEATIRQLCGDRIARDVEVCYAFQDFASLPKWYAVPADRVKPFGTVHAVLCAAKFIDGPFSVLNADDYYGVESFHQMHDFLLHAARPGVAAMMGYRLKNTLTENGDVTRGICRTVAGELASVQEIPRVKLMPDGSIMDITRGEPGEPLDGMADVSMNFWGFDRSIFMPLSRGFHAFLRRSDPDNLKSEFLLPVAVDRLLVDGFLRVHVIDTEAEWFGVTYREDVPIVQAALQKLHDAGVYGDQL